MTRLARAVQSQPNVTPMIDVMLVLLIIFMVVTPVLATGIVAEPPRGRNLREHPDEAEDHVLAIDRLGAYYLNKRPTPRDELGERLRRLYAAHEDKVLYVLAHRELPYAAVREAMDVAAASGVRVLGMVSEQQPAATRPAR